MGGVGLLQRGGVGEAGDGAQRGGASLAVGVVVGRVGGEGLQQWGRSREVARGPRGDCPGFCDFGRTVGGR